jgi:Holliday junction resolvase RusA-like endonuclease
VAISLTFEIHRPLAHYRLGEPGAGIRPAYLAAYPRRPDLDKIARSTLDGLVMGDLLRDDAQVIRLAAAKAYSTAEGCSVSVDEVAP